MYENIMQMIRGAGRGMSTSRYESILYWIDDAKKGGLITDDQEAELLRMLSEC